MTLVAESPAAAAHGQSQSWRTRLGAIQAEYNGGLRQILNDTQILISAQVSPDPSQNLPALRLLNTRVCTGNIVMQHSSPVS